MRYWLTFVVVSILLLGCSKEKNDCMKSTGEIVFVDRAVQAFKVLEVHNNVNVIVTQGSTNSLRVEAGANLQDKITTEVVNDTLIIYNENKCNWVRSYKHEITVHVTMIDLDAIEHWGYGEISSTNTITGDNLIFSCDGNGHIEMTLDMNYCYANVHQVADIELSGKADLFGLWTSGSGWSRCENLVATNVFVDNHSSGDCFVNATNDLKATIHQVGNIHYTGSPATVKLVSYGNGQFYDE